jgi:H+/Cl- antiporter ClcA
MADPDLTPAPPAGPPDPLAVLRSRSYVVLLVFGAIVGVIVATVAYFYLKLIAEAQQYVFVTLPKELGFHATPVWWPAPLLALSGLLVGLTIRYLPGTGGHKPAEGFKVSGAAAARELPGIIIASFATLSLGVVLGPEAPLIAIGGGLGALAIHLIRRNAPAQAVMLIGAAGSFAAISALLGSPIVAAFLLMEAAGLGGAMLGVVLVPGLLAAGVGALIFVGLDGWTGFGTFSLAVPSIPHFGTPTVAEFFWAIGIGLAAAVLGTGIRRSALFLQPLVERRMVLLTPLAGLAVAGLAIVFAETTGRSSSEVLFSGQSALPSLIQNAAGWTAGALVLLVVCKGLAYSVSLSGFRGGPVFPSMFIGAAGGIALSHLPGLPMIAGAAMGIGAMCAVMLGLPLTSVLLAAVFLQADALTLTPLVIVAVTVAYVTSARLKPAAAPQPTQPKVPEPARRAVASPPGPRSA